MGKIWKTKFSRTRSIRIWWVNIDGTDGGPLPQHYGTQRTHETWTVDGKYIAYVSKYRIGTQTGKHFLGLQSIDGKMDKIYYEQVSPGHQNLFKDNKHWIVDTYGNEGTLMVLFTRGDDKIEKLKFYLITIQLWKDRIHIRIQGLVQTANMFCFQRIELELHKFTQ